MHHNHVVQLILILILLSLYFIPVLITFFNISNLFRKHPIKENLIDGLTFILGIVLSIILYCIWSPLDYTKPIILDGMSFQLHSPISHDHMISILILSTFSVVGYVILRIKKNSLSPIISIICFSAIYIGILLSVVFSIQLFKNIYPGKGYLPFDVLYMILFPLNYILCSIRLMRQVIIIHTEKQTLNEVQYKNRVLQICQQVLKKSVGWYIVAFVLMFPLLCLLCIILVLFGQMPDSIIRAFIDTSDWTLSQKISPSPIQYQGHYLCTVAVNGHKNIVKPIRLGTRKGVKILVNRQLCIANAFEQLVEENTPKIHRVIRNFYDKYGYPISKHINTPWRADIVYIVMKPLEWLFLFVLYLIDKNPENRIAVQYIDK